MSVTFSRKLAVGAAAFCISTVVAFAQGPGVTGDALVLGRILPRTGVLAGESKIYAEGMDVLFDRINKAGGINGRKIVVNQHDSALFNVQAKMTEACAQDFFLVGGGAVFDNQGVKTRLGCLLPDIPGYVVTAEARGADLKVEPLPNPIDNIAIGDYRYLGKTFPSSILEDVKQRLVELFGGLTHFRHRNEGLWKVGSVTYRDEIVVLRVLADARDQARREFVAIKESLKRSLSQDEVLVVEREVSVI
jgi:hypothetical protein